MAETKTKLLERKKRIEERLAAIDRAEQQQREKQDKRRAELAGRAVLKHARNDPEFARRLQSVLNAEITGARLRALFDLPPEKRTAATAPPGEPVPLKGTG